MKINQQEKGAPKHSVGTIQVKSDTRQKPDDPLGPFDKWWLRIANDEPKERSVDFKDMTPDQVRRQAEGIWIIAGHFPPKSGWPLGNFSMTGYVMRKIDNETLAIGRCNLELFQIHAGAY